MIATAIHDILLLALAHAYSGQHSAFIILEQIDMAIRKHENTVKGIQKISGKTSGVLIELDSLGFITIDKGRVRLTETGFLAVEDMKLPDEWASLPAAMKPYVRKST